MWAPSFSLRPAFWRKMTGLSHTDRITHLGVGGPLAPGQVYHVEPPVPQVLLTAGGLRHVHHQQGVGPGARLVGRCRLLGPLLVPSLQHPHHLLRGLGGHLGQPGHLQIDH